MINGTPSDFRWDIHAKEPFKKTTNQPVNSSQWNLHGDATSPALRAEIGRVCVESISDLKLHLLLLLWVIYSPTLSKVRNICSFSNESIQE